MPPSNVDESQLACVNPARDDGSGTDATQMVEHRTENPGVPSPNLGPGTSITITDSGTRYVTVTLSSSGDSTTHLDSSTHLPAPFWPPRPSLSGAGTPTQLSPNSRFPSVSQSLTTYTGSQGSGGKQDSVILAPVISPVLFSSGAAKSSGLGGHGTLPPATGRTPPTKRGPTAASPRQGEAVPSRHPSRSR